MVIESAPGEHAKTKRASCRQDGFIQNIRELTESYLESSCLAC